MKFITLLLCLALAQIVSSTVISLEEGDAETKRIFKWILDPASPSFPIPRFRVQNGEEAEYREFRFLATLDCSAVPEDEVAMAIYDPAVDDWSCISTGMLPNDTSIPDDVITGIPFNCSDNYIAVWNASISEWVCNTRRALLFQSEGNIQDVCRSEDLLVVNYDTSALYINRPAGLCYASTTRQVGPDAVVSLKRSPRNLGDPDESFYVQTTSKAVGGLRNTGGSEHFNWQYWLWSPARSSFAASVGSYPPLLAFGGMRLAAVISKTYSWASNTYTATNELITYRVVKVEPTATTTAFPPAYMFYRTEDWTTTTLTAGVIYTYDGTSAHPLHNANALEAADALSIRIVAMPSTGFTSTVARSAWFTVSLWVSHIVAEE